MALIESTNECIDTVRQKSGSAILFCSMGKDSLVLLDLIYPKFDRIVCVFMYFVKDLNHINRFINWAKSKYPNIEFIQVPHWNLSYILRGGVYCVPNPKIKLIKLKDVIEAIRLRTGINPVFLGMKKSDSMNRRLMLNTYSENNYENNGISYPLADWKQKDVLAYMRSKQLPQPVRYSKNASGGVGLNLESFLWMRENEPDDLEKIYKAFPLSRRILFEHDRKQ